MENSRAAGLILIGPPGAGKSLLAKAAGNEVDIPTIALDLGGMKGSLVGESEQNLRTALKVISAVSADRALFIATCNQIGALPAELRRRFTLGTFFLDLSSPEERDAIWGIHLTKYKMVMVPEARPDDRNWTGAEIRNCCETAWRLNITLKEAAAYIVPIAESAAATIDELRRSASGIYIDASKPGKYQFDGFQAPAITKRQIN
jgi:SpoVK/Ycf46/Vps4 family AAA+-type ATPase